MQGFPPPPDKRPAHENWDYPPFNRWSFQNVRSLLPTRLISRGRSPATPLPEAAQDLGGLAVRGTDGKATTLLAFLEANCADGFLVLHRGRRIWEHYLNDMTSASLHLSQSVSKSFTSTLVGILWGGGELALDKPVSHYLPELAGCGYRDALVWQVLDMRSGIRFDEDYTNPENEMGKLDRASGWKPLRPGDPPSVLDLILTLEQGRPHGGGFEYRSIETEVLGWLCSRITGLGLAELMSRELWEPMGAEFDADFTVDRAGTCLADGGLNAALRDYARFGQLFLQEGALGGRQIVPAAWVAQCRTGDAAAFVADPENRFADCPDAAYSRQWWVLDRGRGRTAALGVFGQLIWIDPELELVVVKLSSLPDFLNDPVRVATFAACEAIGRALSA